MIFLGELSQMSAGAVTLIVTLFAACGLLFVAWLISLAQRDASVVDLFWGLGFVAVSWTALWHAGSPLPRDYLLALLVTVWGARLSVYLIWRNWGAGEDRRYKAMRSHFGPGFPLISLFVVFILQAVLLWFVSWPVQCSILLRSPRPLGWLDALGVALWFVGLLFEAVGDWQLARFQANPANTARVLDRGLWRWTRHPNYFGDFCVWWGIYLIAVAGGAWWTVASPLLMSVLLMRISGVTLVERTIGQRRPEYAEYQLRTNAFFPGPRRQNPSK